MGQVDAIKCSDDNCHYELKKAENDEEGEVGYVGLG